jgi:hypothetical protein
MSINKNFEDNLFILYTDSQDTVYPSKVRNNCYKEVSPSEIDDSTAIRLSFSEYNGFEIDEVRD